MRLRLMIAGNLQKGCAVGAVREEWNAWSDYAGLWQEDLRAVAGGWGLCADGSMFIDGKKTRSPVGDFRGKELLLEMDWDYRTMTVTVTGHAPVTFMDLPRHAKPGVTIGGRQGLSTILSCELDPARQVVLQLSPKVMPHGQVAIKGTNMGGKSIGPISTEPSLPVAALRVALAREMGLPPETLQLVLPCLSVLKRADDEDAVLSALRLKP
jgi:hypothetical protein